MTALAANRGGTVSARAVPLSEEQWRKVFAARCQTKQGWPISEAELALCTRAFKSNRMRYAVMEAMIKNAATVEAP